MGFSKATRKFPIAMSFVFVEGLVFFTADNYFAFEVSTLYETDPLRVGICYGINFITYALSAVDVAIYCSATKTIRLPVIVAFSSFVIFNILMATANPRSSQQVETPHFSWIWSWRLFEHTDHCRSALDSFQTDLNYIWDYDLCPQPWWQCRSGYLRHHLRPWPFAEPRFQDSNYHGPSWPSESPIGLPIGALTSNHKAALAKVPGAFPSIIGAAVGALMQAFDIAFRYV
jgi:hypothetical protein